MKRRLALALVGAVLATEPASADDSFADWLSEVRADAREMGVPASVLDTALASITGPLPKVLELDRKQWSRDFTLDWYLGRVISDRRVRQGREMGRRYRSLLERVGSDYGVQPRFLLAIWGIETNYGDVTGGFPVLQALATLAFDGRRQEFFRTELLEALHIMGQEGIAPETMLGSWAGAMGQSQFMPTSFSNFAEDYDGDGRRDIWATEADVFASIANYLKDHGWRDDMTWGREVRLPDGFDSNLIGLDVVHTIPEWQEKGVRRADGSNLPTRPLAASVIAPDFPDGSAFLVYENFRVTMSYNKSSYYATAVGILSDRIARGL